MTKLGDRVRELRTKAGMSLRELARAVACVPSSIGRVELGATETASEDLLVRMARALGSDADELLQLAGKVPSDVLAIVLENRALWPLLRARDSNFECPVCGESVTLGELCLYDNVAMCGLCSSQQAKVFGLQTREETIA